MSLSQSSFISAIARISFSHYLYLGLSVRVWVWAVLGLGLAGDDGLHVEADRGHHLSSGHTQLESRKASLKLKWFTVDVCTPLSLPGWSPVLCRAVSLVTGLPPLLVSLRDAHGVSDTQILGLVTHVSHLTPVIWLVKNLSHYHLIGQLYFCHAVMPCLSDLNLAPRIPPKPKPLLTLH